MRAIRTALLLTGGLLALVLAPAGAAEAAGPGITFYPKQGEVTVLPGALLASAADLPARTYTLPDDGSGTKQKITVRGLTITKLLARTGQSPSSVGYVQVVNESGASDIVQPSDFARAILSDDGRTTRLFRPAPGGVGAVQNLIEADSASGPLDVSVEAGSDLAVKASASPKKTIAGKTVRFTARVRFGVPGQSYSYEWDFGDGSPVSGASVSHAFDLPGPALAQVTVKNTDPSCTIRCGGVQQVTVDVGDRPEQPKVDDPTPGGDSGDPNAPGSAGGTGGGGQGGSGGGSGTGTGTGSAAPSTPTTDPAQATPEPEPKPKPAPTPKKPFGITISGVLINDTGTTVRKLPQGTPAGAPKGVQATRGGEDEGPGPIGLGGILAAAVIGLGALRERRGVKLRVA